MSRIRQKIYNAAFFLINTNYTFEHSFGVRLKIVGLNLWLAYYGIFRNYFQSLRLKAIEGETFK